MTDILLITDIPRLRKIFSRLAEPKSVKVRIANNLEKGGEELAAEKPTFVFVQTHLSGLSADIILMHLKKQLGRKRTRFVLLATKEQAPPYIVNSYHGHIDISDTDETVQTAIKELISTLLAKPAKKPAPSEMHDISVIAPEIVEEQSAAIPEIVIPAEAAAVTALSLSLLPAADSAPLPGTLPEPLQQEPSAIEQGIAYPSRPRLSVYSEFNSSFDSAVNTMEPAEKVGEALQLKEQSWQDVETEEKTTSKFNTKRNFLLWLAPVVIVVVLVTFFQQNRKAPAKPTTAAMNIQNEKSKIAVPTVEVPQNINISPATPAQQPTAPPQSLQKEPLPASSAPSLDLQQKSLPGKESVRLKKLPDFVPSYGYDKNYGKENPGWERYKGEVTEFKILREGEGIKAIQILDRGGAGIPESFMKGALRQLAAKPSYSVVSVEKKEGYEIQRGRLSDSQDIVYYRDADGGRLRGFVITWR